MGSNRIELIFITLSYQIFLILKLDYTDPMAEHDDGGDSGASLTFPQAAGQVKKGMMAILKGQPCLVHIY